MVDLVNIGYVVNAKGLKEADKELDKLLKKLDKLNDTPVQIPNPLGGGGGRKPSPEKDVDKVTKSLERQAIVAEYLSKGYDKATANAMATFKQMGASTSQLEQQLNNLGVNKGLVQHQKELERTAKLQARAVEEGKKYYEQYRELSTKSYGGGILDVVERQNKELKKMGDEYRRVEQAQDKVVKSTQKLATAQERIVALEKARGDYQTKGYSASQSNKLATLQVSGADDSQIKALTDHYNQMNASLTKLAPTVNNATTQHNKWLDSIKGIAFYAVLSAGIYGVMTAFVNLSTAMVRVADEYTAIQNRMKLYVSEASVLDTVNQKLVKMSIENNVGLRESATLYSRLAPSMQKLGANTQAITTVVDAFGKSMRIGGATAMEASSAVIQFSQAMASGKLQGDEFRSISEASPRFLKAIAEGAGIATEELKKMSSEGMLTTELVAKALIKEYPKLIAENKRLGATLEQGWNGMTTAFTYAIGEFNEGAKITETLGKAMLGLAEDVAKFATEAKESGEAFKKNLAEWQPVISGITDTLTFLATVIASKYVASLVLARIEAIKAVASQSAIVQANTASARSYAIMASAVTAFGNAMQKAYTFFGGWAGIALTVAGVAGSYLMLQDSTEDATRKLAEQNEQLDLVVSKWKDLNKEQQLNAISKLNSDMDEANSNLEKMHKRFVALLTQSVSVYMGDQGYQIVDAKALELVEQARKGVIDYGTAIRKAKELKLADSKDLKALYEMEEKYNDVATSTSKVAEALAIAGQKTQMMGSDAQNASPMIQGLKDQLKGVGDTALDTKNKFEMMVEGFRKSTADFKTITNVMKKYGVDASIAERLYNESQSTAGQNEAILNAERKIQEEHEAKLKELGDKATARQRKQVNDYYKGLRDKLKLIKGTLTEFYVEQASPYAKEYQKTQDDRSDYLKTLKEEAKVEKNSLADQLDGQLSLLELLEKGHKYDLAKIASTKDYIKWYGSSLTMAQTMLDTEKAIARLQAKNDMKKRFDDQTKVAKLLKEGFSQSTASSVISLEFDVDSEGINYASNLTKVVARDRLISLSEEVELQKAVTSEIMKGVDPAIALEVATLKRVKHDKVALDTLAQTIDMENELLNIEKARTAVATEIMNLRNQANTYVNYERNEIAELMIQYKGINAEEAQQLLTQQKIVEKLKEYNAEKQKQRSLDGMLENVDFDLFGSFGDPFQGALESLNEMVFKVKDVAVEYERMFESISEQQSKLVKDTTAWKDLELQKTKLLAQQEVERGKSRDKNIKSGLALTKSFFKEETTGYKVIQGLERAYQASQIAFALWQRKDSIQSTALELANKAKEMVAQSGLNVLKGVQAVLEQAKGDPYTALARMGAMVAVVAGLGVAIGSVSGGDSGSYASFENNGTGTVFGGGKDDVSKSISNSLDILSENSDLMLPINNALLRSVQNIESAIGGVANLLIRGQVGSFAESLGFDAKLTGTGGLISKLDSVVNKLTVNLFSGGLSNILGDFSPTNILGGLIGNFTNSILGGLFGRTSQTVTGSGLYAGNQSLGSIISNGMNLQEYADIKTTKKSWFGSSSKYSTKFQNASSELKDQFSLIFSNIFDSILIASGSLGADETKITDKLKNTIINIGKINTKDKTGSEIQELLEGVIGQQADIIAKNAVAGLEPFQQVGEGYYETLVRVASSIERADYYANLLNIDLIEYTDIINKQGDVTAELIRQSILTSTSIKDIEGGFKDLVNNFDGTGDEIYDFITTLYALQDAIIATGKDGDYLTTSMILGAGGADKLKSGLDDYYNMLSLGEQYSELTRRMTNSFATYGQVLPKSIEEYKNLISSIDITTAEGQKLYGQLISLAGSFNDLQEVADEYNDTMKAIRQALYVTGQSFSNVTQAMFDSAGGMDNLLSGLNSYYNMLSDEEKAIELTRRMTEAFGELGLSLPSGIDGFKELVKGIDTTTKEGQELFGSVIALAPEFANLDSALSNARKEIDNLINSLQSLVDLAINAQGETDQNAQLDYLRAQFAIESGLALNGDIEATKRMIELGKTLLSTSKSYATSSEDYLKDIALVQGMANGSIIAQETGLGYTTGNNLTLTPNNTPSTETSTAESETNVKLEALRNDMIIAINAVAKYTQQTANQLTRWDDGDRMMVRIEQDSDDAPLVVKNV